VRRLLAALVVMLALPAAARAEDLAQYVDPTIGTLAPGFVFPGADVPFGMVQNSPDTFTPAGYDEPIGVYSGYMGHHPQIRDFSLVHLSGPGVAKAGDLPFMPWVGVPGQAPPSDPMQYATPFTHATEQASAGYYAVTLANGIKAELTSATHAAMQRYSFPPAADADLIVDPHHHNDGATQDGGFTKTGPQEITGFTRTDHYPVYFVARFDQPITSVGSSYVSFAPGSTVTMRVGISFVDADGARRNLDADAPAGLSFEQMRAAAYSAWDDELHKIAVGGGTVADKRTFYTALYHSLLHPNVFTDVDGRYRGFDDQIHSADGRTQYANFSSWDTYKATNQLQALLEPERYGDMLRSLLADAQQGGHLPRWAEEDYDPAHMSGDPAIPMIADGYCRGVIGGDEAQALYEQAVALVGRRQAEWQQLGYLPIDKGYDSGTGTTLEYGVADFALALMAHRLGLEDDAQRWLTQSLNYRKVLDPDTKWVRPRNADGSWYANFDPAHDETGFQEGNSWQYSWLVPQDPRGLFDAMGGDAAAVDRLDHLFTAPAEVQNRLTAYGILYRFDQWAPGNEHDLGAPYLYPFARQPWKTAAELAAARQVWRPTVDGIPGNDDLGGLSAWYVWNALGFGPFTPGAPLYMVGSPVFPSATIALNPRQHFTIDAPSASPVAKYVQGATLDGKPLNRAWFENSAIRPGGALHLDMGATPNKSWASRASDVPPSASDSPLSAFGCDA
jgi:putative alpha-1,2-mannosidase